MQLLCVFSQDTQADDSSGSFSQEMRQAALACRTGSSKSLILIDELGVHAK
jgi:hypothetical protein